MRRYHRLPGRKLSGRSLERHILNVLRREDGLIVFLSDLIDSERRLERNFGLWLGSRGFCLYIAFRELIETGKMVGYKTYSNSGEFGADIAFCTREDWARIIRDCPEIEKQRVYF